MYALVDCNNFYASCERVFQPKLKGKPIIVLSNNDGCVIARSNEAKALGIPMGAPAHECRETVEKHDIKVFSSNYALYGDMSNRVMTMLKEYSPEIEVYSIDEAFLKLAGFELIDNLQDYGLKMKRTVTTGTGIPISIGIAPTKSLAKVANKIAKKFPDHTKGVHVIDTEENRIKALKWLPVEDIWGVGRQHAKRLAAKSIKTAFDFTLLPESWVRDNMSVVGLRLHRELRGTPCIEMELPAPKKNIATTRSFEKSTTDFEYLRERVTTFAVTCSEKLRKQRSEANAMMVFIHTNGFRPDQPQYSRNTVIELPFPTNSAIELARYATIALKQIFREGYQYKKAGVVVMDFTPADTKQLNLFQNSDERHISLMNVVDKLNQTLGSKKVRLAVQDLGRTWKMRQEKLSPNYTTRIADILKINC